MDMDGMEGMSMGDMNMGEGVPTPYHLQKIYWTLVGAAIATASLIHLMRYAIYRQRLHSSKNTNSTPSRPKKLLPSAIATTTALCREIWYFSLGVVALRKFKITAPALGPVLLCSTYAVAILVLCFYGVDVFDRWQWEDLGYRTGYIATAQLPLVYMLSAKNNIIGFVTGKSYERLNWLHRWAARMLFITATIHLIFWFKDWAQYDYILVKLQTDKITQRGFAAWIILLWIVLSSFRPFRALGYEFFVIQHVITAAGFSGAIYLHLPNDMKYVFWIAISFPLFDRLVRTAYLVWNNVHLRPTSRTQELFGHHAIFERRCGATRITIEKPGITWKAGQHVFLSCHSLIPLQSHPFTIASLPEDGKLVFIAKVHRGGTRRIYQSTQEELPLLESQERTGVHMDTTISSVSSTSGAALNDTGDSISSTFQSTIPEKTHTYLASFEGPYGSTRPLHQFDSIMFVAGSTGSTFTLPLLRSVLRAKLCCTTFVRFVWVIKSRDQIYWLKKELNSAASTIRALRSDAMSRNIDAVLSIYITCDDEIAGGGLGLRGRSQPVSATVNYSEKEKRSNNITIVEREVSASAKVSIDPATGCQPNGTCCCTATVEEDDSSNIPCSCHCAGSPADSDLPTTKDTTHIKQEPANSSNESTRSASCGPEPSDPNFIDSMISILSGRPHIKNLMRATLEQARGESAVVVCGPDGLVEDTRQAVVQLSDERAVHKGTGAQGIYLHTEAFSF